MAVLTDKQFYVIAGVVVIVAAYAAYRASKAADVISETLKTDLNPASQDNFINRAFTDSVRAVSGRENWTLGGWLYDLTHEPYDPNAPVIQYDAEGNIQSLPVGVTPYM